MINDIVSWYANHISTSFRDKLGCSGATHRVETLFRAIPPKIFAAMFTSHNDKKYFEGDNGTIAIVEKPTKWYSKIDKNSFLHGGFMCDILNNGHSFEQLFKGKYLDYFGWNLTYEKAMGNLRIVAFVKWRTISVDTWHSNQFIHAKDAKFSRRPLMPDEADARNKLQVNGKKIMSNVDSKMNE